MAIHCDALARVLARLEQTLAQGFTRSFLRVCKGCNRCVQPCLTYMCARAPVHARWITSNPCNSCNPCSPFFRMAVIRHSLSTDRARVAQGCACSCKGRHPRGGGETLQERRSLDRYRSHSGVFSASGGFSGLGHAVGLPFRAVSPPDASQTSTGRSAALRPATSGHRHAACRGYAVVPRSVVTAINFPHVQLAAMYPIDRIV